MFNKFIILILIALLSTVTYSAPSNFSDSKIELRKFVYYDQTGTGTFYCGCKWQWAGASGGRIDLNSCGYQIRAQQQRAQRLEWEHIVPASNFGRARQCWQKGGRKNCNATDRVFNVMEADMHNLAPSIGEVNGDRSNFNFGQIAQPASQYGACNFKVDFRGRVVEPADEIKGRVARTYFYMSDRYAMPLSKQQQQLFMAWNKLYPVTKHELMLDARIAKRMGHHNPFITGEKAWGAISAPTLHRQAANPFSDAPVVVAERAKVASVTNATNSVRIHGNKRSNIYHLSVGCPDFNRMSPKNVIEFNSEESAIAAGYRKALNCR